jgi:hypothetical protein
MSFILNQPRGAQDDEWKRSAFGPPYSDGNLRRKENWRRFLIETRQRAVRVSLYSEYTEAFMDVVGRSAARKGGGGFPRIPQMLPFSGA